MKPYEKTDLIKKSREKALYLLAKREYSRYELANKLAAYQPKVDVEKVLDELKEQGLQSDTRFLDVLIRSKVNQGYGYKRIDQWIKQYGVSYLDVEKIIQEHKINWLDIARKQKVKKFGPGIPIDDKQRQKQFIYLYNRGFDPDQIQQALKMNTSSQE